MDCVSVLLPTALALALLHFGFERAPRVAAPEPTRLRALASYALVVPAFAACNCITGLLEMLGLFQVSTYLLLAGLALAIWTAWSLWTRKPQQKDEKDEAIGEDLAIVSHGSVTSLVLLTLSGLAAAAVAIFASPVGPQA